MRLTVGPLPSAVYWRRRAVVLGALLLILVAVYAACSPGSDADPKKTGSSPTPTPTTTAGPDPDDSVLTPESGAPSDGGSADPGTETGDGGAEPTEPAPQPQVPANTAPCGDDEITITPQPAKAAITRKSPVDLRLIVQNSSNRTCSREVGADYQELRIVKGADTLWSSDRCGPAHGSDVVTLDPGAKREFMVTWNGRSSSSCTAGVPSGAHPDPGQYHVLGRVGTKLSSPVVLTIT